MIGAMNARWLVLSAAALAPACTSASFTVAPAGDGGADATADVGDARGPDAALETSPPGGCRTNAECGGVAYCAICPGLAGVCRPLPPLGAMLQPVCGCDGVTYWNGSFAAALNVDVVGNLPCTSGTVARCNASTGVACPSGTVCMLGHETAAGCTSSEGTCWRTSYGTTGGTCPTASGANPKVRVCGSGNCTTGCAAILEGRKFYVDPTCP